MAEANSYEEQRRMQVEENKRKLEELRLHRLSAAVRAAAVKPMPAKPLKPRNPRVNGAPIRRSGRIASLPEQPDYRVRKANSNVRDEERAYAITRAEELKDQLGSDHPTFIKPMTHSYATKSDMLCIPMHFNHYLPVHQEMMVLVDELNNDFELPYYVYDGHKCGLGRWKRFAADRELADGDCLVFQLIERLKFKVYIIRASYYSKSLPEQAHPNIRAELPQSVYATNEERVYAITKAEELKDQLDSLYPTFVRPLTLSHATGSYLNFTQQFSKRYLPWCDEIMFLVDKEGAEFEVLYHARSSGLSAPGWKQFATDHKLAEGDCLVFQLIERKKFKVYIIRASSYYEKDH